jgi:hypothetical protein
MSVSQMPYAPDGATGIKKMDHYEGPQIDEMRAIRDSDTEYETKERIQKSQDTISRQAAVNTGIRHIWVP